MLSWSFSKSLCHRTNDSSPISSCSAPSLMQQQRRLLEAMPLSRGELRPRRNRSRIATRRLASKATLKCLMPLQHNCGQPISSVNVSRTTWHFPLWWERKKYIPRPPLVKRLARLKSKRTDQAATSLIGIPHTWPSKKDTELIEPSDKMATQVVQADCGQQCICAVSDFLPVGFPKDRVGFPQDHTRLDPDI